MRIAYFDCSSGISGDMCLGALISAGASLEKIKQGLSKIPIKGYRISTQKVFRSEIEALKLDIKIKSHKDEKKHLSRWNKIKALIEGSDLETDIKEKGLKIIKSIFLAEAIVHGESYDRVHLHELSYIDTAVDIFGTLIALKELSIDRVYASSINTGGGFVETSHGRLPVPAPATLQLLKGLSIYSTNTEKELTTPTGAAIIRFIANKSTSYIPKMTIKQIGIGAGSRDIKGHPNVLRVFIGEKGKKNNDEIYILETNIDDMNPQLYEYITERLFEIGALDVFLTQVIMKKGRPGVLLTALCTEDKIDAISKTLLKETTTIGVRFYPTSRITLKRQIKPIDTPFGKIRFKTSYSEDKEILKHSPEYEDIKKASKKTKIPIIEIEKKLTEDY